RWRIGVTPRTAVDQIQDTSPDTHGALLLFGPRRAARQAATIRSHSRTLARILRRFLRNGAVGSSTACDGRRDLPPRLGDPDSDCDSGDRDAAADDPRATLGALRGDACGSNLAGGRRVCRAFLFGSGIDERIRLVRGGGMRTERIAHPASTGF